MHESILTLLGAVAVGLLVALMVPLSQDGSGMNVVKESILFSTARIGTINISLSVLLAMLVTMQGFLLTIASLSLLSQTVWLILARSKAPLNVIDAALRNYPQSFFLLMKQPFKSSTAVVILVFLPIILDTVQHSTVQTLVMRGVAKKQGSIMYRRYNTSLMIPGYDNILARRGGVITGLASTGAVTADIAVSALRNCRSDTSSCGSAETNADTSLIMCDSVLDCTQEVNSYHDFDMACTRNITEAAYPGVNGTWLNSTVSSRKFPISGKDVGTTVNWTIQRFFISLNEVGNQTTAALQATLQCRISSAWVTRVESKLGGTLNKTVIRRYDSAESVSKENASDVDSISGLRNLSQVALLSTIMEYLEFALKERLSGTCTGDPVDCENRLHMMPVTSELNLERLGVAMIEEEMGFAVEMLMKYMFLKFMPLGRVETCTACSSQNAHWASLSAATAFFGVVLGFTVVFSGVSIYVELTTGCDDSLITGQKLLTVFGKSFGSGIPIISMDQEGLIVVEGVPKEQTYLIADQ
ncbi:hypothetical protein HDU78_003941 [Chytriomyces hyalinus]|nr:hypothetical protein HDU78_003941 [Chytriomyces hyalinus]